MVKTVDETIRERRSEVADGRYFSYPGQKTALLERIASLIPSNSRRLVEPFVGSGVVASALAFRFEEIECSDALPAVVAAHSRAQADPEGFARAIADHFESVSALDPKEAFERSREEYADPATGDDRRAVLLIYLGAKSFSRLVRHNSEGGFSASWHEGKAGTPAPADEILRFARNLGGRARFSRRDFAETMALAGEGDFVYCDPPYMALDGAATNFEGYAGSFGRKAHERLARLAREAAARGAKVVVSNHDSADVRLVYADADDFVEVSAPRRVGNGRKKAKARVRETLIVFRPRVGAIGRGWGGRRRLRREDALDRFGLAARAEDMVALAFETAERAGFVRDPSLGRTHRALSESGRNLLAVARDGTPSLRRLCLSDPERVGYLSLNLAARMAREAARSPEDRTRTEIRARRWERLCVEAESELRGLPGAERILARALRYKAHVLVYGASEIGRLARRYAAALRTLAAVGSSVDSEEGSRLLLLAELCPDGEGRAFSRICSALTAAGTIRPLLRAFPPVKEGPGHGIGGSAHVALEAGRTAEIARAVSGRGSRGRVI
jgi:DNA adenine methylase